MLCFFCESNNHISQCCKIYATDETRKKILRARNCCQQCLGITDKYGTNNELCPYSYSHRKCYNCFSRSHYTLDCTDLFTVLTFFLPNIDQDMILRFLKILTLEEKYFLLFTFPKLSTIIQPKPLKITYTTNISFPTNQAFSNACLVVVEKLYYQNEYIKLVKPKDFLIQTNFQIRNLVICRSNLSIKEFFKLLSVKTKVLKCVNVKFYPNLPLCEILKIAPILEELDIHPTNVKITNTWLDNLVRLNRSKYLKYVRLAIPDFYFNLETLVNLIRKKQTRFHLFNFWPSNKDFDKESAFMGVKNKLSSHFVHDESFQHLKVSFYYIYDGNDCFETKNYKLNDI